MTIFLIFVNFKIRFLTRISKVL